MKLSTLTKLAGALALSSFAFSANAVVIPEGVKLAEQQVINFNVSTPDTIDPTLVSSDDGSVYVDKVFDPLTRIASDNTIIPNAATSWEVSEDGLTWTFHLREGATWQDGVPVKASDFVYSWRRLVDPKTAANYGFYLGSANVKNADNINSGKEGFKPEDLGVEAKDDNTLVVTLERPTPWLPAMLSYSAVAPLRKDIIEKYGTEWTKPGNYIGNGPFIFKESAFNDYARFVKWDGYWDAKNIYITNINFDFIKSQNNSYFGYLTGKYLAASIPPSFKKKVMETRPDEVVEYSRAAISWIVFNPERVKDVNIRKAISLLIDRRTLVEKINNFGAPTATFVPNNLEDGELLKQPEWFNQPYEENVKEANAILDKAGYTADKPYEITYLTAGSNKKFMNAFSYWINKNSNGKINLKFRVLEDKAYYDARENKDADFTGGGWYPDYFQVSTFFNVFLCDSGVNVLGYCNPEYDKVVNAANINRDAKERQKLYAQALEIIRNDYVVIPTDQVAANVLLSPALGGYNPKAEKRYTRDYYIIADKKAKSE